MSRNQVWNLKYALGNTYRIVGDSANPQSRKAALDGAKSISAQKNPWRCWVEHHVTGERIFENPREQLHRQAQEATDASAAVEPDDDDTGAAAAPTAPRP